MRTTDLFVLAAKEAAVRYVWSGHSSRSSSGAACPNPCEACAFDPVSGSNSDAATIMELFTAIGQGLHFGGEPVESLR